MAIDRDVFQPSSDLQAGCNRNPRCAGSWPSEFQPSSDLQAGCNRPPGRRRCGPCTGFNPHPTFRPDATMTSVGVMKDLGAFQPSSDLQAGCNHPEIPFFRVNLAVSTLIRPSGRMQHGVNRWLIHLLRQVSTLIRPSGRMQQSTTDMDRFIFLFQPSSDLQAGCNSCAWFSYWLIANLLNHAA